MNRSLRVLIGLAAGAVLLSSATYAAAQEHPAQGHGAQGPGAQGPGAQGPGAMAEKWKEHLRERAEVHARALHDILNIRPDQDAAFQAFMASMKPPEPGDREAGDHRDRQGGRAEFAHLTTPQRLDRMAAMMAEHQARFQHHADAVKAFYAALNPEQQRAFDALQSMRGMDGGPGFGGGHGGPGPGDGPRAMEGPEGFGGADVGPSEEQGE